MPRSISSSLAGNFSWRRHIVKFSDECSIQKGSGATTEWCFRYPEEKWKRRMITEISTGKIAQQMVWGAIWLDERGRSWQESSRNYGKVSQCAPVVATAAKVTSKSFVGAALSLPSKSDLHARQRAYTYCPSCLDFSRGSPDYNT